VTSRDDEANGDERRIQARTSGVLPVRLTGLDVHGHPFQELAHTLDIAPGGVRLGTVHRELKVGEKVSLHFHGNSGEFEVMWVKAVAPNQYQVGLRDLAPEKNLWKVSASASRRASAGGN
jgi:hypothetical protein